MIEIELPWPNNKLSPNGRGHWGAKETPRKAAIEAGYGAALPHRLSKLRGPLQIALTFHPPDKARNDWDNLVGRMKYYQDGICKGLGINDNRIKRAVVTVAEPEPGGRVIVEIEEA